MKIIFVDWIPIEHKNGIRSGGHIRRYYAWTILNNMFDDVVPIRKKNGAKIKAANDGKVIYIGWQKIYGNFIIIRHNNKKITTYAHLDKI